jgi:hypothetical protein
LRDDGTSCAEPRIGSTMQNSADTSKRAMLHRPVVTERQNRLDKILLVVVQSWQQS